MLSITTNGYFLERRITPELLPYIAHLHVSMDGLDPETFAINRGGADVERVWCNVEYFNRLRKEAHLARRPRLCFAWALKRNNVAELPRFVHRIAAADADLLTVRHLMVFFPGDAAQSSVSDPATTNRYLRETYELLEKYGIDRDCVPLLPEHHADELVQVRSVAPTTAPARPRAQRESCMFIHRMPNITSAGEVLACSVAGSPSAGWLTNESFASIWNGPVLRDVRARIDTDSELEICRTCWYRAGRFATQRDLRDEGRRYSSDEVGSPGELDFTGERRDA
jgi:MoaA/NifB/PqqE/SkfB family radical SAM enzyme